MRKFLVIEDYLNKKINRLLIVASLPTENYHKRVLAICECGNRVEVVLGSVVRGHTKSCGCYNQELRSARGKVSNLKHGLTGTPEYKSWQHMLSRCYTETDHKYPIYGGRGIKVCDHWRNSFENFLGDMGKKPASSGLAKDHYTLGRIDNDKDYCPENCRWELPQQQADNRSMCKKITIDGITLNRQQWATKLGIKYDTVMSRVARGLDDITALTAPVIKKVFVPAVTIDGVTLSPLQWSIRLGIRPNAVRKRIRRGWSAYDAITTPMDLDKPNYKPKA